MIDGLYPPPRPAVIHFHEKYPFGSPTLRSICGELMASKEHGYSFKWEEVTCSECLTKRTGAVSVS